MRQKCVAGTIRNERENNWRLAEWRSCLKIISKWRSLWETTMRRRDSLRFRFSNHSLKKEFAEDQGLLTESDDCCEDQSPSRNSIQIRPSCIDGQDEDSSNSWFTQTDSHAEQSDSQEELRNIQCILLHLRPHNKDKPSRQLSDLFSRVVKPKIHLSRSKCVLKQESKIFDDFVEVGFYATF